MSSYLGTGFYPIVAIQLNEHHNPHAHNDVMEGFPVAFYSKMSTKCTNVNKKHVYK